MKQCVLQDNYVLAKLFAKTGVHSAIQHDAIIEDRVHDYAIIESEANKVRTCRNGSVRYCTIRTSFLTDQIMENLTNRRTKSEHIYLTEN